MDAKKILLSGASTEAKLAAIAILLGKELPEIRAKVYEVEKLQGPQGEPGKDGKDGKDGKNGKNGLDGAAGRDGKDGKDGEDGDTGVSIVGAKIDFDGSLVLTFSDGTVTNVGEVVGERGAAGLSGPAGPAGPAGADGGAGVPVYMDPNEVFTVKKNKQALFTQEIQIEAGAVIVFEQRSVLLEVT
jgi:hypothetical protein